MDMVYNVLDFCMSFCDLCIYGCYDSTKSEIKVVQPTCEFVIVKGSTAPTSPRIQFDEESEPEKEEESPFEKLKSQFSVDNFNSDMFTRLLSGSSPKEDESDIKSKFNFQNYDDFCLVVKLIPIKLHLVYNIPDQTLAVTPISKEPMGSNVCISLNRINTVPIFVDFKYNETKKFENIEKAHLKNITLNMKILDYHGLHTHQIIRESDYSLDKLDESTEQDKYKVYQFENKEHRVKVIENFYGSLRISLCLDLKKENLVATIVQGRDLKVGDGSPLPDVYCTVELSTMSTILGHNKTSVKKKTDKPIWNESFSFDVSQKDLDDNISLKVKIFNNNENRPKPIGHVSFTAKSYFIETKHWATMIHNEGETITEWHPIKSKL